MRPAFDLIAIGGSAGSLQPILKILEDIKPRYPIPVLLVIHRNSSFRSPLEDLLVFRTKFHVREIEEKDEIEAGNLYICPADYHVLVENDKTFSLDDSEKVNFSRPSIDVVFKSAADIYREKLLCLLFSGANSDGSEGLAYAKKNSATVIIQDPGEAQVPFMPQEAIKRTTPDHVLNTNEIAGFLNSLVI